MSSNRRDDANMNPLLVKMAIAIGVAAVSGIAAMFYYNRQREEPYRTEYMQDSRTCSICLDTLPNKQVRILNCGHIYHEHCIQTWERRKSTCPLCGRAIRS